MKKYFGGWSTWRFLRLAIGIFVFIQGIVVGAWLLIGLGVMFTLYPLMNMGCGSSRCRTNPYQSNNNTDVEDIDYEEVE